METLGAAWARFTNLINAGPNLSLPDHVLLHHFHLALSKDATLQLDLSLGGSFTCNTISERKAILEKILENTPYTSIYDEFPKVVESAPDQQEEAPTTEFEIPSNPNHNPVVKEPPIKGTYHTSRDDELHPFTCPFEFEVDLSLDDEFRNSLECPNSTSSYASNSYMRHEVKSKDEISSELIEGEPMHIEAIFILSPSMPTLNVSSKTILDLRGELMAISAITMTYPSLVKDSNSHEKESASPKTRDFVNEQ